ncbi:hypothetical protein C8Q79DRAFT_1065569 [Trametes meyenii]|nr:hypothetical protein C8Q79DRAFT_1065569 [Trametes meyenii]
MEYLSEEHVNLLLVKEWLAKGDSNTSTPYLLKFYASTVDLNCLILITDTKNVWGEVLTSQRVVRRWRDCNPQRSPELNTEGDEKSWPIQCLDFLSRVHSLGGVSDLVFEVVRSNYSDLAFELRNDTFRWRWETFGVGPRMSADILSKHLIMPLISATHLSFSSAEPVSSLSEADLEKSTDRVGRIARRTVDTHVKGTLSKPLVATTLRRMSAVLNLAPDPPRIVANVQAPDLTPPSPPAPARAAPQPPSARAASPPSTLRGFLASEGTGPTAAARRMPPQPVQDDDSVTEEEPEEDDSESPPPVWKGKEGAKDQRSANARSSSPAPSVPSKRATPDQGVPPAGHGSPSRPSRDESSSPLPKKSRRKLEVTSSSDSDDSEGGQKAQTSRRKNTVARGVKQPIKRGGRRF